MQHLEFAGIRRSVLAALVIAFLIPVGVAVWALTQLGGSTSKTPAASVPTVQTTAHHATVTAAPAAANYRQSPLFKTLLGVNESAYAKGYLPPSTCKANSSSMVTCMQPHYAVDEVIFRTFPSLTALYSAYEARVSVLAQGAFRANYGNCTETDINGEIGWNHNFRHPSYYPISMFTSGQIKDEQAAGRMYCTFNNDLLYLVWTQDDGRLMGELAGAPHLDAYLWWHNVHHVIALPGTPNMMQSMPGMQSTATTHASAGTKTGTTMKTGTAMKAHAAMKTGTTMKTTTAKSKTSTSRSQTMPGMSK